jgi:hypothetical protein
VKRLGIVTAREGDNFVGGNRRFAGDETGSNWKSSKARLTPQHQRHCVGSTQDVSSA